MTLLAPTRDQWTMLRAGIVDLWEFDRQEFWFHQGRLILRGRNESGKSKTLELLLPFLLDASTRPERISAERNHSRLMIWNLFNDQNPDQKIRTGYVWLEFGRRDGGKTQFLTIGAGLHARRGGGSSVQSWYFITPQRLGLGEDFELINDQKEEVVSRRQLPNVLGESGEVFDNGAEYRQRLNQLLFGMEDDQYDALIHTLLELRQPKLSKNLDIDRVGALLSESLPPLDAGTIDNIATDFEQIEEHRREVAARRQAGLDVKDTLGVARRYAALHARASGDALISANSRFCEASSRLQEREQAAETCEVELAQTRTRQSDNETALRANQIALDALIASEAYEAVQQIADRQVHRQRLAQDLTAAEEASKTTRQEADLAKTTHRQQNDRADRAEEEERAAWKAAIEVAQLADLEVAPWEWWRSEARNWSRGDADKAIKRALAEPLAVHKELDQAAQKVHQAGHAHSDARRREEEAYNEREAARTRRQERLKEHKAAEEAFRRAAEEWFAEAPWSERPELPEVVDPDALTKSAQQLAEGERDRLIIELSQLATTRAPLAERQTKVVAEIVELDAATHSPPEPPSWRRRTFDSEDVPLYMLCDFLPQVSDEQRAVLEGSMLAAGLLDAQVAQDGSLQASGSDIWAAPLGPCEGPSLAEVLAPSDDAMLPRGLIEKVLTSIPLVEDAAVGEGFDRRGGWRFGGLYGRNLGGEARYIGQAAREAERARRLRALRDERDALEHEIEILAAREQNLKSQVYDVNRYLDRFPSSTKLTKAETALTEANADVNRRQEALDETSEKLAAAQAQLDHTSSLLTATARRLHREDWVLRLVDLEELLERSRRRLEEWARDAREAGLAALHLKRLDEVAEAAKRRDELAGKQVIEHSRRLEEEDAAIAALRDALDKAPEEIFTQVDALKQAGDSLKRQEKNLNKEVITRVGELSKVKGEVDAARTEVNRLENTRNGALAEFQCVVGTGLLRLALNEAENRVVRTLTDALELTQQIASRYPKLGPTQSILDRQENRLTTSLDELRRKLPREFALEQERRDGVLVVLARSGDELLTLDVLEQRLREQVTQQERLLEDDEARVFTDFLTGSTRRHLRKRLVQSQELVDRTNRVLEDCPTPQGTKLRLRWRLSLDAPDDAERAVSILLRDSDVQTLADREALQRFLQDRLNQARLEQGSLKDRMLELLDYRRWHQFELETSKPGQQGWQRLTKKGHGAGSGGQKAVLLHLPLFAAAAAFYDSASESAPRLVLMDEAFAGVDPQMRADLLGILCRLRLDFVLTSYSEWGCYAQVDGTAIYNLFRDKAFPGVLAERYVWDGTVRTAMEIPS